ncbi:MAG TPA: hypothetical protein VFY96_00320, partial [Candidatus Binatia bacterium]|nr:hypothetical protein [Candidatus Binatia bacterium]
MVKQIRLRLFAVIFSSILFLGFGVLPTSAQDSSPVGARSSALPTLEAAKTCLSNSASAECLDQLFREALKTHSVKEVLQLIEQFEAEDPEFRRDCHPVVHAIGRETFRSKNNLHEAFAACDQTC